MQKLSVYIHIPFCKQKCLYCDFLSMPTEERVWEQYVEALCAEIKAEAEHYRKHQVATVFLGGGTPSLLSGSCIEQIIECLREHYCFSEQPEMTMEMNPGTVTAEKLSLYRKAGINRISLGLQSADNQELRRLGRIHTWEEFLESYRLCREAGFSNINIDLMSALPGQTYDSYMTTLEKVAALSPEHISAYSLIVEEGTPFYTMYDESTLPDEEADRAMYEGTKRFLEAHGYYRYEISNYAKKGKECAHNCVYWNRGDYVGFGLGAASMVDNIRWSNIRDLQAYLSLPDKEKKIEVHPLSKEEQMEETMFLGLRLTQGVSKQMFRDTFSCDMESVYGKVLKKHEEKNLLLNEECVRLTDGGIDVSNYVLSDFLF